MKALRTSTARLAIAALTAAGLSIALAAAPATTAGADSGHGNPVPLKRVGHGTSLNWSGYAAKASPNTFNQVSARWTQPSVSCGAGETSYSSVWAGLDGDGSNTVEQTGTDADCSSGSPQYYAWYEMYPKYPVYLNLTVRPGDQLSAAVTYSRGSFTLTISDATAARPWTFTTTQRLRSAQLLSAEVIVEAPSSRSGVLPLANFGTVSITASTANGQHLGAFSPEMLTMVASDGTVKAQPSSLANGTDFSVTWKHA
jgi:Peptidase A4 family